MTNFKIIISKEEGESVHGDSPLSYPVPKGDNSCWYTFFKCSRNLHLKIKEGDKAVCDELDRLAVKAMSPEGLVLKACDNKHLCHAHAVEEILQKAFKGGL